MNKRIWFWTIASIPMLIGLVLSLKLATPSSSKPHFEPMSGDLAAFFLSQASNLGAGISNRVTTGKIETHWEYSANKNGFQMLIPATNTAQLVQTLTSVLGKPEQRSTFPHILFHHPAFHILVGIDTNSPDYLQSPNGPRHHITCISQKTLNQTPPLPLRTLQQIQSTNKSTGKTNVQKVLLKK